MQPFIHALCEYVASRTGLAFGSGETEIKVGEISRDSQGIFAIDEPTQEPDRVVPIRYAQIGFWAKYKDTATAYTKLNLIYNILDRMYATQVGHTSNYNIYFGIPSGPIIDLDRDAQGDKILKFSAYFIYNPLDIVS
jgi:hypothetical protein